MLYRYRYAIGYGIFSIALISLLVIAGLFIPGGINDAEMQSAATSAGFSLTDMSTWPVIDLPYHMLQKASIELLGLSDFSIKLPSLLLAFLTGIGFLMLLLQWFRQNVAILAAIIAVTASQFLIIAQSGTASIMLMFWSTLLLLAATYVSVHAKKGFIWKLIFFICVALSLYTPLSIYILVAMLIAAVLHPHLRYMLLRLSFIKLTVCLILSSVLLVPLLLHFVSTPMDILTALGLPHEVPSFATIRSNLLYIGHALFGFTAPVVYGEVLLPLYGLSAAALMTLGFLQLIVDHHSARTYTIGLWIILLGVLLALQPESLAVIFIPMLLMLAIGIDTLYRKWYGLFPNNPYARIAALVPLAILMGGIVFTGADRFMNSYRYSPDVASTFSRDLSLVRDELAKEDAPNILVVESDQHAFYSALTKDHEDLVITDQAPTNRTPAIITRNTLSPGILDEYGTPSKLIVNDYSTDSLRFYLYK